MRFVISDESSPCHWSLRSFQYADAIDEAEFDRLRRAHDGLRQDAVPPRLVLLAIGEDLRHDVLASSRP